MPERTEQLIQYPNVGLHLMGPKRMVPRTALRRALGIHASNIGSLKSRRGETLLYNLAAVHSLGRLNTDRFQGAADTLYRNNASLLTGMDGTPLTLLKSPPSEGLSDYLFVTGGGVSRKILADGTVQNWGIDAPADGLTVAKHANNQKQIEAFEDHTTWTYSNVLLDANEPTVKQQGVNSLHVTIEANKIAVFHKALVIDLTTFGAGVVSADEDTIEFWIRIDNSPAFDYILMRFDVGAGNFATDYYQYKIVPTQLTPRNDRFGIGISPLVNQNEETFVDGGDDAPAGHASGSDPNAATVVGSGGDSGDSTSANAVTAPYTWTRIRIPKASFFRSGAGTGTWANVAALQFLVKTNSYSYIEVFLDDLELIGAVGTEGRYRYHSTFRNTTTGNRSNPEPTYVELEDVHRQSIDGTRLQVSTDTQVNQREIWRTIGNGTVFFRAFTVDNNTATTFSDEVADYIGLSSKPGTAYLQPTKLDYDNAKPRDDYTDTLIDSLTAFWLLGGRLYYSPLGRPEGVKGFITVTYDTDTLQRIVIYNGIKFVFSINGVYRIDGTDPYTRKRVTGVPGVPAAQARTVTVSPYGICYQAADGVRLFDGTRSELVHYDRLGSLFRGEMLDYFPPFEGIYGAWFHNQYFLSNGTRTLAFNFASGFIRELGIGLNAMYFEDDTKLLLGALPETVSSIEDESAVPYATFDIETGSLALDVGQNEIVKRLRFKGVFHMQPMQPTLFLDDIPTILPSFTLQQGSVEYIIGQVGQSISVRLQNVETLTQAIELESIEVDIYATKQKAIQSIYGYRGLS